MAIIQRSRDVGELIPWLSDPTAAAPENVRQFLVNPELLRDVTPRQRSLCRATICLILASGDRPLDFHSRAVLNDQLLSTSASAAAPPPPTWPNCATNPASPCMPCPAAT